MKTNPNNHKDNVEKAKKNIDSTDNMEAAYEMFGKVEEPTTDLRSENERRQEAPKGMRSGIKDDAKK